MKRFWKDQRGSSLVLVMVCMSFLIVLAGAVISTTITNIRLKTSQKKTQENFYSTDSALDEIAAGIKNMSSKASADAYQNSLTLYNASKSESQSSMDERYTNDYLDNMVRALVPGHATGVIAGQTDYKYDDLVLEQFLKADEQSAGVYIHHEADQGDMELEGDSLVLKKVSVKKTLSEDVDYDTTLTTNIRIEVPSVTTEAHSEYLSYALLADDQIVMNKNLPAVFINGNIYAGTVNRDATDKSKAGIVVEQGTVGINSEYIITRGDLAVYDGGSVSVGAGSVASDAKFWAENVVTEGQNSSLTIDADSYVADDLEINGANNQVTLQGRYYGYNYTDNYSSADLTSGKLAKQASYSSSISVNGKNDRLIMENLKELVLAGRTFISKKTADGAVELDRYDQAIFNPDVELGESLAVRSSQLAYLVGVQKDTDTSGYVKRTSSLMDTYSPPAGSYGYGTYMNGGREVMCYFFTLDGEEYLFDYQAYINSLGLPDPASDLGLSGTDVSNVTWDYINAVNADDSKLDRTQPLCLYYRPDPMVPRSDVRYFYLNFANTTKGRKAASGFYDIFFNKSTKQTFYDEINKSYLDGYGIRLNNSANYILASGNLMSTDASGNIKVTLENSDGHPTNAFTGFATESNKEYMSRQLSLVSDYEGAKSTKWRLYDDLDTNPLNDHLMTKSGKSDKTNLFDVLVDRSKLPAAGSSEMGAYTVTKTESDGSESSVDCAYVVANNAGGSVLKWPDAYTNAGNIISGSDYYAIIVASGDVEIKSANFHGMVISGGDVNISVNSNVNSDEEVISNVFEADKNGSQAFYNVLSKYFRKSVDATIGNSEDRGAASADNVTFENWKKNPIEETEAP